jgi:hypothetical protein
MFCGVGQMHRADTIRQWSEGQRSSLLDYEKVAPSAIVGQVVASAKDPVNAICLPKLASLKHPGQL